MEPRLENVAPHVLVDSSRFTPGRRAAARYSAAIASENAATISRENRHAAAQRSECGESTGTSGDCK